MINIIENIMSEKGKIKNSPDVSLFKILIRPQVINKSIPVAQIKQNRL